MTEIGHGSDVSSLETTADFDISTREFVLNSPTPTSVKMWPGALAKTANISLVYARLRINSEDYGIHAFIVPIRSKASHKTLPGVTIGSMGKKNGINYVDNGFMSLSDVRIPYDNLLDRLS